MDQQLVFTDIANHWAKDSIEKAVDKKLFNGTSSNTFSSESSVTRAMAVTVLGRFAGADGSYGQTEFTDVVPNSYYENFVAWGVNKGVVNGVSTTEFAPDIDITREQLSAMIIRYLNSENITVPDGDDGIQKHSDYNKISPYAVDSMTICYGMGLITGHETGLLAPQEKLTRAQFATIMLRLENYIANVK